MGRRRREKNTAAKWGCSCSSRKSRNNRKFTTHVQNRIDTFRVLLNDPNYSDVEIICENQKVLYVLKAILLTSNCGFFHAEQSFSSTIQTNENDSIESLDETPQKTTIYLTTISFETMYRIMEFMYTGFIQDSKTITSSEWYRLIDASVFINYPELTEFLAGLVVDRDILIENPISLLKYNLNDQVHRIIIQRLRKLMTDSTYFTTYMNQLDDDILREVLTTRKTLTTAIELMSIEDRRRLAQDKPYFSLVSHVLGQDTHSFLF